MLPPHIERQKRQLESSERRTRQQDELLQEIRLIGEAVEGTAREKFGDAMKAIRDLERLSYRPPTDTCAGCGRQMP